MKITKRELLEISGSQVLHYEMPVVGFSNEFLRRLEDVKADLTFYYDTLDQLIVRMEIDGEMVCPCAVTLEDVYVPFELHEQTRLSFTEEEDVYCVAQELDIEDLLLTFILPEVPIKVVKEGEIEYPRGDGWRVMTEEDFEQTRKSEIDPRWQKLKDIKFDEEE